MAGLVLGALAFKPQLALALPGAFLAIGARRTIAAAAAAASLTGASVLWFGPKIASAFLHSSAQANARLGGTHMPWAKVQSLYGAIRGTGAPFATGAAVQAPVALVAAIALVRVWRSRAPYPLKAAAVATATLLLTPYCFVYDLPILGVAALFLLSDAARARFSPGEAVLLALGVFSPLAFAIAPFAVTPLACAALALLIAFRLGRPETMQLRRFNTQLA